MKDSSILITGATGSFGRAFVSKLLSLENQPRKICIYSRDELKQSEMQKTFSDKEHKNLRYFLGDIRDRDRLAFALKDVDIVVHAAALKQVPAAEYNPFEFIKTNTIGAQNLIDGCLQNNVKKVIALSTDKAVAPINLYGATKLCSDKLFIASNSITGNTDITFSVVRYGNVMGSRGSVIPYFLSLIKNGSQKLPITDPKMTRFNITLSEGVDLVLWAIKNSLGGEIIVPKIPSYRIMDLLEAMPCSNINPEFIGVRPGEKLHEEMITVSDAPFTVECSDKYLILNHEILNSYPKDLYQCKVDESFSYASNNNSDFLSVNDLKELLASLE